MPAPAPFVRQPEVRPSFSERLLRRRPRANIVIEVNNLLADAPRVRDVEARAISRICIEYGTELHPKFAGDLERFYRVYLEHCLADHHLTAEEVADLDHLRSILGLDVRSVRAIHENVARQIYCKSVDEVLEDGTIDAQERAFLHELREHLGLPVRVADRIEALKKAKVEP